MNEELNTVNSELQDKVDQLSRASDDMANLLNSTEIAAIFLDAKLCIKNYTEPATKLVHLIRSDLGRPLSDLRTHLESGALQHEASEVQRTLVIKEGEVETVEGRRYLMRMMPYRTAANVIDGVVITFVDITDLSEAKGQALVALELYGAVVETVRGPVAVLDEALRVQKCNRSFFETFGLSPDKTEGELIYDLADGAWGGPQLRLLLEEILPMNTTIEDFSIDHDYRGVGPRRLLLNARRLDISGRTPVILLAMEDRTTMDPTPARDVAR
jgi:two-component system CheB/CheR fusion protein